MKYNPTETLIDLHNRDAIQARRPLLVAHRGGVVAPNAPENSLAAIQLAAAHGYDMVELDVRQARDGEPALFHGTAGQSLLVDCGVERFLGELGSDELRSVHYRGSTESIAMLADALALCASLRLGVMLDIKDSEDCGPFLDRIAFLLRANSLESATVTISRHPAVRERLSGRMLFPVTSEDWARVLGGQPVSLAGQYWFGWAVQLPSEAVTRLQAAGAFAIVSINTFHYPAHAHRVLARQDIKRLLAAGAEGFQIDSVYEKYLARYGKLGARA